MRRGNFLPRYRDEIGLPFWCYSHPTYECSENVIAAENADTLVRPSEEDHNFDHQPVMNFTDPVPERVRQSA